MTSMAGISSSRAIGNGGFIFARDMVVKVFTVCVFALIMADIAESAPATRRRSRNDMASLKKGFIILAILAALVFVVPVLYFCVKATRDPMAPTILNDGLRVLKERTFGYLGKQNKLKV
jgi:hypothetical protein